jgi:thioredoxin-dependent peroxiredoxin
VGLSFDTPAANLAFKEKFDFPYDLLSDEDGAVSQLYGAAEAGAEKAARISVLVGADGKVSKAYATVKPPEHPDEVLADLG